MKGEEAWVEEYLKRIGVERGVGLAELQVAHLMTVPFENLSVMAGETIVLEREALWEKIVTRRRGGFCYELNGLFAELLEALGSRVERLAARVVGEDGTLGIPFDHLCLRVDGAWLVDVGFGDSFVRPLRIDERGTQRDGRREFRIVEDGDGAMLEDDGAPVFRFEHAPHALADFAPGCAYHTTSPASHFTQRRVISRLTEDGRITLRDDRLITTVAGVKTEARVEDDAAWQRIARERFGIA